MPEAEGIEFSVDEWVRKLRQQAEDSREYRHALYQKVGLSGKKMILDVGCGTGAVTHDISELTAGQITGIDIDDGKLDEAKKALAHVSNVEFKRADVLDLPFEDGTFDLVVFNIVLVYVEDQQSALDEMARVTAKGGHVLATLEPDYASRISYPEDPFSPLFVKNMEAIGADVHTGRKLKPLFTRAGLRTEVGIETAGDYVVMKDDAKLLKRFNDDFWLLEKIFSGNGWHEDKIEEYRIEMGERIENGLQFGFTPCFYAIGTKV